MADADLRGKFITLEGVDGAGKSTHVAWIAERLKTGGREVVVTREPGGTRLAEKLRALVLAEPMDPLSETLLMFAARADHVQEVIAPALARGAWVVCDRFTDSTFAYQVHGRQFSLAVIEQLEQWVLGSLQPDLTLWFDLPPAMAAGRLADARSPDRFELEQTAFFERVRDGYAQRAATHPARFVCIDALGSRQEIWQRVKDALARAKQR